jgi:dTDP-4-dehydrorhamnose reductase
MKILITGADGQLGECLQKVFKGKAEIYAFNRNDLDITDKTFVTETVSSIQPDFIINAAAYTAVDKAESESEKAYIINAIGPKNLAIVSAKNNSTLIHISTDYVFDGKNDSPYKEVNNTNPQSVYGKTKLDGENFVKEFCKQHIILRTSWVFSEYGNNFVKTMLNLADKETLNIVSDQVGGPTYAMDIALAVEKIIERSTETNDCFGTYNLSGEPYCSWYDFAVSIFAKAKELGVIEKSPKLYPIATINYPTPAIRPESSRLDNSKINDFFGINPSNWNNALNQLSNYKR